MKKLFAIIYLLLSVMVFGQDKNPTDTNCLAVVKLKYKMLDSNAIKAIEYPLINSKYDNIISYVSKGHTYVSYCVGDKNKWTTIEVPFTEATNDFKIVFPASNKDSKLFIRGSASKTEIRGRNEYRVHNFKLLIINIGGDPTKIFEATYACDASVIPFDGANKATYSYKRHERIIDLTDYGLIISTPANSESAPEGCQISDIEDGTYLYEGIGLKKSK